MILYLLKLIIDPITNQMEIKIVEKIPPSKNRMILLIFAAEKNGKKVRTKMNPV